MCFLWYNTSIKEREVIMKKYLVLCTVCALTAPAFGAGRSMVGTAQPAARATVLPNAQLGSSLNTNKGSAAVPVNNTTGVSVVDTDSKPAVDRREKERLACVSNNVGVGNTFVWASRTSNTSNYSMMVEDTENPDNNVCFVLVGVKSEDSAINVSDIQPRYFQMGETITCGSWTDEENLKQRILDAKKSTRTLATIGGAVGGAAIGVGSMELFGNKLIGGAVQGQKALQGDELLISQLKVLKKDNSSEYKKIVADFKTVRDECKKVKADDADAAKQCEKYDYDKILSAVGEK